MATYNGEKFLREQIDSILNQLTAEDELIISDDGSIDRTLEIINNFKDSRIIVLHNQYNHGVNGNFQNALSRAVGDFIFLADQDDVWLPGKVEVCLKALQSADCVVHDAIVVDGELDIINESFFQIRNSRRGFWKNIMSNTYLGCCMAFKREMLKLILPIPKTNVFFHDNWIGGIIDLKYKLVFIPFKGILFRRHSNNTSSTAKKSNFSIQRKLLNRLTQIYYTFKRAFI